MHPDTFWIPDREARQNPKRGQGAKLIFEIEGEEKGAVIVQRGRMWVVAAEKIGETYTGILEAVFAVGDHPPDNEDFVEGYIAIFQVAIADEGHEDIGGGEQGDRVDEVVGPFRDFWLSRKSGV